MSFQRTKLSRSLMLAFGGSVALATLAPVQAQVVITGSSIKRIEAEGALPVTTITREEIARTGATNTVDLLQRLPSIQQSFGESGSVGGGNGFSSVSVHGIGDTRTLVLLNGRRLAQWGGQTLTGFGAGIDLNTIPVSAIARIEILSDGASAIYGSDAIAGVVNFITVQDSTDGIVTAGGSWPQGGSTEYRISAQKGWGSLDKDGFNVYVAAAYDERDQLNSTERDYASTGRVFFTDKGKSYRVQQFSPSPIPANVLDDVGQLISPYQKTNGNCPEKTFRVIEPYPDGSGVDDYCGFDFVGELEIYPIRKRTTLLGNAAFRLGDHELFAEALWGRTQAVARIAPVPGSISIPVTSPLHAQYLQPIGITGDTTAYYRLYDMGKRESDNTSDFTSLAVGSRGALMGWDYNASLSYSSSEWEESTSGYPGALAVGRLRQSGLLDPFVGPGMQSAAGQEAINATNYRGYWDGGKTELTSLNLSGSRELMKLGGGQMMLGTGFSYQWEKFRKNPSLFAQALLADPVAGTLCDPTSTDPLINQCDQRFGDEAAIIPYDANRRSWGLFAEVVAPVAKELELIGALRYDDYSDFGGKATWKAAFRWTPMPSLLVRGAAGTGFHAPTVPQVNASIQPYGVTNNNYTCTPELEQRATEQNAVCQPGNRQYDVLAGGNANLQPETSRQASLGIRFEPAQQLSLGADYWWVAIESAFGQISQDEQFKNPLKYDTWTSKRDTGTGINYLALLQSNVNLGNEYYSGIDFDIVGRAQIDLGLVISQLTATYMLTDKRQLLAGGEYYYPIGDHNDSLGLATFRWQGRWATTLRAGGWDHTLALNFKSGITDATTTVDLLDANGNVTGTEDIKLKLKEYVTLDWQSSWRINKNFSVTAGILNIFDEAPPLSISSGGLNRGQQFGYDDRYYDPRGRTFYLNGSFLF
jgi:iron complex outermembrane receptor protein